MGHSVADFWMTLVAVVGGTFVFAQVPEAREFTGPIVMAFVGSWLRAQMPTNGNGKHSA